MGFSDHIIAKRSTHVTVAVLERTDPGCIMDMHKCSPWSVETLATWPQRLPLQPCWPLLGLHPVRCTDINMMAENPGAEQVRTYALNHKGALQGDGHTQPSRERIPLQMCGTKGI